MDANTDVADSGLYIIIISLGKPTRVRVGALGVLGFEPGVYLYVGSARRSLSKRIGRHAKPRKPSRWHIDYLRKVSRWVGYVTYSGETDECSLANNVMKAVGGFLTHEGFGSSDCRCRGHLIFTRQKPEKISATLETIDKLRIMEYALSHKPGRSDPKLRHYGGGRV